jgi:hypothetical protein
MLTNLHASDAKIALSFKGQFLILTASNTEISHRGYFYEIKLVIGISNEQERIQFTFSDYVHDVNSNKMKWTQSFYLAPYFFGVLASNTEKALITIDDREKSINELINSLSIKLILS